ncbi:uncharacterized protein LOC117188952 [Drosophila miranda]|uniref:uncharacterized protein LOC117188952 n=1 Tax=Drosophila miranda TaxID=7229 RepID=UPI00143F6FF2|nr:uncharacterized protein LOC117188952 [Drosophila miranda]
MTENMICKQHYARSLFEPSRLVATGSVQWTFVRSQGCSDLIYIVSGGFHDLIHTAPSFASIAPAAGTPTASCFTGFDLTLSGHKPLCRDPLLSPSQVALSGGQEYLLRGCGLVAMMPCDLRDMIPT